MFEQFMSYIWLWILKICAPVLQVKPSYMSYNQKTCRQLVRLGSDETVLCTILNIKCHNVEIMRRNCFKLKKMIWRSFTGLVEWLLGGLLGGLFWGLLEDCLEDCLKDCSEDCSSDCWEDCLKNLEIAWRIVRRNSFVK